MTREQHVVDTNDFRHREAELESKLAAIGKQIEIDQATIRSLDAKHKCALEALELQREDLRDKFAMAALMSPHTSERVGENPSYEKHLAASCYRIADAMLEARNAGRPAARVPFESTEEFAG
jgi:hypothetical protein